MRRRRRSQAVPLEREMSNWLVVLALVVLWIFALLGALTVRTWLL